MTVVRREVRRVADMGPRPASGVAEEPDLGLRVEALRAIVLQSWLQSSNGTISACRRPERTLQAKGKRPRCRRGLGAGAHLQESVISRPVYVRERRSLQRRLLLRSQGM